MIWPPRETLLILEDRPMLYCTSSGHTRLHGHTTTTSRNKTFTGL